MMKKHKIEKARPEFTKKAAEEWKSVSAAVKATYEKKAEALKAQYNKDLEAYKAKKAANDGGDDEEGDDEGEEEA